MRSMTGFGRGEANSVELGIGFRVEISSVNRKQFELKLNLPREVSLCEPRIRIMVSESVSRGSLMLRVDLEGGGAALQQGAAKINESIAMDLTRRCRMLQEKLELQGKLEIGHILALPGVVEAKSLDYGIPEVEELLCKAVSAAISNMLKMREDEGQRLRADIESRLFSLTEIVDEIEPLAKALPEFQRDRLMQRLKEAGLPIAIDDDRILRELVIFADKADVTEEITRLRSHFVHFKKFLDSSENSVGRSLDFMIQEISREATTLGNKAANTEVSPLVIHLKTELEKIREQVQNVE